MKDILDSHTHTIASGHAYSTLHEMARAAADKGLELLGITEHAMSMPGTCHEYYFMNMRILPRTMYGIEIRHGAEVNIMDTDGRIDMDEYLLKQMDVVLLELNNNSLHPLGARQNPLPNDIEMLEYCMKYGAPIVLGSDAHTQEDVGNHKFVQILLEELDFPEELIVNRSVKEYQKYINRK